MVVLTEATPDSPWKTPLSGFGIDTVRLRGPATIELMEQLPEKRYTQLYDDVTGVVTEAQRSGYTAIAVKETLVRVKADLRTGTPEVAIEYSAPSVLVGHNRDPLPLSLLPAVAETVHDGLNQELTGLPDFERLRLLRLDVDRDFTPVRSIPATLWAVAQRRVVRARTDRLERGANGLWQSLTRGNVGSWVAVGYGKGEQLAEAAEETYDAERRRVLLALAVRSYGTLRWELQLRREFLRQCGVHRLHDVDEEMIYNMSQRHFDRTRFSDSLADSTERLTDVVSQLTSAQQRGVLSLLAADLVGLPAPMSHGPEDEYRALARRLSLVPDDLLGQAGLRRRLDFTTGTEVVIEQASADHQDQDRVA